MRTASIGDDEEGDMEVGREEIVWTKRNELVWVWKLCLRVRRGVMGSLEL